MSDDATLGGYLRTHGRAAAFTGSDGKAYTVDVYVDDTPDAEGRYGAALLFVRWSPAGDSAVGHVESGYLSWGTDPAQARERIRNLSLFDVKSALDQAIAEAPGEW